MCSSRRACEGDSTIGTYVDSYFEYLLKDWVLGLEIEAEEGEEADDISTPSLLPFAEAYASITKFLKTGNFYAEAQMASGQTSWYSFTSLQGFWPGLQTLFGDERSGVRQTLLAFLGLWNLNTGTVERYDLSQNKVVQGDYPLRPELFESLLFVSNAERTSRVFWFEIAAEMWSDIESLCKVDSGAFANILDASNWHGHDKISHTTACAGPNRIARATIAAFLGPNALAEIKDVDRLYPWLRDFGTEHEVTFGAGGNADYNAWVRAKRDEREKERERERERERGKNPDLDPLPVVPVRCRARPLKDLMSSFFLAETLKYLFLHFSNDESGAFASGPSTRTSVSGSALSGELAAERKRAAAMRGERKEEGKRTPRRRSSGDEEREARAVGAFLGSRRNWIFERYGETLVFTTEVCLLFLPPSLFPSFPLSLAPFFLHPFSSSPLVALQAHLLPRTLLKRVAMEERGRRGQRKEGSRPWVKRRSPSSVFTRYRALDLLAASPRQCPNHVAR